MAPQWAFIYGNWVTNEYLIELTSKAEPEYNTWPSQPEVQATERAFFPFLFFLKPFLPLCWHKSVYLGKVSFLKTTLCLREQDYIMSAYFGVKWASSNYYFSNPSSIQLSADGDYMSINSTNQWLHNELLFVGIESQMNILFNKQAKRGSDIMPRSARQRFKPPGGKTFLLMFYLILPFHHYAFLLRLI